VALSATTVWRDVLLLPQEVKGLLGGRRVRCLGLDGSWARLRGKGRGMMVAVEMEEGLPLAVLLVDEKGSRVLLPLLQVRDNLGCYRAVVRKLGLRQQLSSFHLRRWAGREPLRLEKELEEKWQGIIAQIEGGSPGRAPDGGMRLLRLWQGLTKLRPGS